MAAALQIYAHLGGTYAKVIRKFPRRVQLAAMMPLLLAHRTKGCFLQFIKTVPATPCVTTAQKPTMYLDVVISETNLAVAKTAAPSPVHLQAHSPTLVATTKLSQGMARGNASGEIKVTLKKVRS